MVSFIQPELFVIILGLKMPSLALWTHYDQDYLLKEAFNWDLAEHFGAIP